MTVKTLLALLLLGAACAQAQTPEIAPVDPVDSKSSTSSVTAEAVAGAYRGDLQLGNRTVRYALDLDAHNRFVRREEVLDDAGKVQDRYDAAGAYVISQDGLRLVLIDQYGGQHVFERIVNEEWRPFDLEGMTRSAQGRIYRKDGAAPTSAEVRLRAEVLREGKAMCWSSRTPRAVCACVWKRCAEAPAGSACQSFVTRASHFDYIGRHSLT